MRSPLWILNSILALLFVGLFGFMFLRQEEAPVKKSLVSEVVEQPTRKEVSAIDLTRIYANDLFSTYTPPPPPVPQAPVVVPLPPPPVAKTVAVPQPVQPQFLPPLAVTLKGIISSSNERDNVAIIADNKTKQEALYRVGDIVEDAELIRVSRNKIILIRSNGQQETIFISAEAAKNDPIFNPRTSWTDVVYKVSELSYEIDPEALAEDISLAQFIDMLDITSAVKQGVAIGCRIGQMTPRSIGHALGLHHGDIVTSINGIETTSTKSRVAIFRSLQDLKEGSTVPAKIIRNDEEITLLFVTRKLEDVPESSLLQSLGSPGQVKTNNPGLIFARNNQAESRREEAKALLEVASDMMPFVNEVKKQNQKAMAHYGGREALLQRMPRPM
jgi:general secretion pathway protein C